MNGFARLYLLKKKKDYILKQAGGMHCMAKTVLVMKSEIQPPL